MKTINSIILSINLFNILCYNVDLIQGIRGGEEIPAGKFTYHAIILINGVYACGGAAVNSGDIVSAGQCVLDFQGQFLDVRFDVIVGVTAFHPNDTSGKIKVDYIYVKNNFRTRGSTVSRYLPSNPLEKGDLAVLKLQNAIPSQLNIHFLEIPPHTHDDYLKYFNKVLNISGFGLNSEEEYRSASDLETLGNRLNLFGELTYSTVLVRRTDMCENYYRHIRGVHLCGNCFSRPKRRIGACLGDAGDPLVFENMLVGILQYYVPKCDDTQMPAVYTRVSSFVPFIVNAKRNSFQSDMRLGNYTGAHVHEEDYYVGKIINKT